MVTSRIDTAFARVALGLCTGLCAQTVLAQSITMSGAPQVAFSGNVAELVLGLPVSLAEADVAVYLPDGYELVAIRDSNGNSILSSSYLNATCPVVSGRYVCSGTVLVPGSLTMTVDAALHPSSGDMAQRVVWSGSFWPSSIFVSVRLRLPTCGQPMLRIVEWVDVYDYLYDPATQGLDLCNAPEIPTLVRWVPVTSTGAIAPRQGGTIDLALEATTSTGARWVNEPTSDTSVLERLARCRHVASGAAAGGVGDAYQSCTSGELTAFAHLTPLSDVPASIRLEAVDVSDPSTGDLEIRAALAAAPVVTGSTVVAVERNVEAGTLLVGAISADGQTHRAEPTMTVSAPARFDLRVTDARNSHGGFEPFVAQWAITAVDPPDLAATVGSWLTSSAGASGPWTLDIATLPPVPVALTLTAVHRNPDGTETSAAFPVVVARVPRTCAINMSRATVGAGETTELRVLASDGYDLRGLAVTWTLQSGGGDLLTNETEPLSATYTAPLESTVAVVQADLVGALCPEASLIAKIEAQRDLHMRLRFTKASVETGELARAKVVIDHDNATPVGDLVLRLRVSPVLAVADAAPRTNSGATAVAAGRLRYALALDAARQHQLDFAFLAQSGFGCGEAHVVASLHRGASEDVLVSAVGSVQVRCEPELTQATVFGRVFNDANNNGAQDSGEIGVPGALVASAASVYAITDLNGDYHLPRLAVGRHSVKLDMGSMSPGATADNPRREVTLTPGAFVRVSYAVHLPSLTLEKPLTRMVKESGIRLQEGKVLYQVRLSLPTKGRLTAVSGTTQIVAKDTEITATLDLPTGDDHEYWLLTLQAEDGRVWFWELAIHVYGGKGGGRMVVPWGPRFVGAVQLPVAATSRLPFSGQVPPGTTIMIEASADARCTLDNATEASRCELTASAQQTSIRVTVDASADPGGDDPPALVTDLTLPVSRTQHFFVGRLQAELGSLGSGLTPRGDGDGAFFYRGRLRDQVFVTAGAALPARELLVADDGSWRSFSSVASQLLGHDPRRVFRDLDPELYYPTYGDQSVSVDEREAGGRFFARVQAGKSFAKWGGINTAISDVEYGQYIRSLYGFGTQVQTENTEQTVGIRAIGFAAQPDSVAARDELTVTLGSLYYLAHRDVVEGSLRVAYELLDEVSGLAVRVTQLVEGIDYEADYLGGHISLDPAVLTRSAGSSLTAVNVGGAKGRLIVDYEYYPGSDLGKDLSTGGRVVLRWGPLSVGGTTVGELPHGVALRVSDLRYRLFGATARLDLGSALQLRGEWASSEGTSHVATRSQDGGLTSTAVAVDDADAHGTAAAVEATSALGPVNATAYGRLVDAGFSDSRTGAGAGLRQVGGRVAAKPWSWTSAWAQADHREVVPTESATSKRDVAVMGVRQALGLFDVGVEGRYYDQNALKAYYVVGGELGLRVERDWRLFARRCQQVTGVTVARQEGSASSVGVAYKRSGDFRGAVELGLTDRQRAFGRVQASMPLVDGTEMYTAFVSRPHYTDPFDPLSSGGESLVVGGRRRLENASLLYSEQQLTVDGAERRLVRSVGAQTLLTPRLGLVLAYERGTVGEEGQIALTTRDAGSVGVVYPGPTWSLRLGTDARSDVDQTRRLLQLGGQGRVDWFVSEALTLAAGGRGASVYTRRGKAFVPGRQTWEASTGFAWRPKHHERVNAFGRYAITEERTDATAIDPRTIGLSHTLAGTVLVNIVTSLDAGPKVYYRHTALRRDAYELTDQSLIAALRGDWHLTSGLDASAEGRMCQVLATDTPRAYGALLEASALLLSWLRLGAGYNLSAIATEGVRCQEPGARGFFVRGEAVY